MQQTGRELKRLYLFNTLQVIGEPEAFGVRIGDDQREPVFMIGFRIRTKEEVQRDKKAGVTD